MESLFWYGLGWISLVLSGEIWKTCRTGRLPSASQLAAVIVAGHLAWNHGADLWAWGGLHRFVVFSFGFHCVSPVAAFWWFGVGGALRRWTLRSICFGLLTLYAVFMLSLRPTPGLESPLRRVALGAGLALLPFLWLELRGTLRRGWQSWALYRQHHRARLQERRQKRQEARERRRQLQEESRKAEQLAKAQEERERLQKQEQDQASRLATKRREILDQVRQIRALEVQRLREGKTGLLFHPHYGFLLAEAARTLRAEIATGERIPPIENDTFLLEVVEHLLKADDFQDRYCHQAGRQAMDAINAYLLARQPLEQSLETIRKLELQPEQLAPTPFLGETASELVEGWLLPHRRFQELERQQYLECCHPQQDDLEHVWCGDPTPSVMQWRREWDRAPWRFASSTEHEEEGHHERIA